MKKTRINPWQWQDQYRYSQAWRVDNPQSIIYIAGQIGIAPDGQLAGEDFQSQCRQAFRNLQTLLAEAGASFENIVKVTVFMPDISNLQTYGDIKAEFITGPQPASTALEVKGLAWSALKFELEAVAVL
jgi:2-iminobutanoate/2-iminopropanoate deaminase